MRRGATVSPMSVEMSSLVEHLDVAERRTMGICDVESSSDVMERRVFMA